LKKVLVLAIDALDYYLVKKYDLPNLKQNEYGSTKLPVKEGEPIRSPAMWVSFITGESPEVHGITGRTVFKSQKLTWLRKNIGPYLGFIKNKSKILEKIGGGMTQENSEHLRVNTIFDFIPNSLYYNIPGYKEPDENFELRERTALSLENRKGYREIKERMEEIYTKRREEFLYLLEEKWELLVYHFYILDGMQHLFSWDENFIKNLYLRFEELAEIVKTKVSDETLIIIVSDHGQSDGKHTHYGFYSVNKPLNLSDPKLIDFYQIIMDYLEKKPYTEEEEKILADRLRKLGYVS
jgi:predicted AlkP superfamily pyrophosphatase or phosphodiesterase